MEGVVSKPMVVGQHAMMMAIEAFSQDTSVQAQKASVSQAILM